MRRIQKQRKTLNTNIISTCAQIRPIIWFVLYANRNWWNFSLNANFVSHVKLLESNSPVYRTGSSISNRWKNYPSHLIFFCSQNLLWFYYSRHEFLAPIIRWSCWAAHQCRRFRNIRFSRAGRTEAIIIFDVAFSSIFGWLW